MLKSPFFIKTCLLLALFCSSAHSLATSIIAASVLPVSEHTRITIESDQAIRYSTLTLKNPDRIVLDLKNIQMSQSLKNLTTQDLRADPNIAHIRAAQFQQNITRLVIDLKSEVNTQVNTFKPASGYQHRLTLDIYHLKQPLAENPAEEIRPATAPESQEVHTSSANSAGAKIILETLPAIEPDEE